MKVIAVNGSPRTGGNTEIILKQVLSLLEKEGIDTEIIGLAGKNIQPCDACRYCRKNIGQCHIKDDVAFLLDKMLQAEGIILGTPVYIGSVTAQMKALIDRAGYIARGMQEPFRGKVAGAVVVARRAGHNFTLMQLYQFFSLLGMVIVTSSCYWNIAFGREKQDVLKDEEGVRAVVDLAENMALVMKKLKN